MTLRRPKMFDDKMANDIQILVIGEASGLLDNADNCTGVHRSVESYGRKSLEPIGRETVIVSTLDSNIEK